MRQNVHPGQGHQVETGRAVARVQIVAHPVRANTSGKGVVPVVARPPVPRPPTGKVALERGVRPVAYLTPTEVSLLAEAAYQAARLPLLKVRDRLLVRLLFQTALRISEALALVTTSVDHTEDGLPFLRVVGKGQKPRIVALPAEMEDELFAYAYQAHLDIGERFFPIVRWRAWAIIKRAAARAGLTKRVYPHLFRHSGAIERLRQTGHPKALQDHLGHATPEMTLRYLSTLQAEDSLRIQSGVEFGRER